MADDIALVWAAQQHHHLLTVDMVQQLGVGAERWERLQSSGAWVQVTPRHFRHAATPLSFDMQVRAGGEWLDDQGALFADTALRWLDVDVPKPMTAEFLVHRSMRYVPAWMTIHTSQLWDPRSAIMHRGIRTTTAARAIVDLASTGASAKAVEHAIDAAIRQRRTAVDRILHELGLVDTPGRRGRRLLKELLLDSGGESDLERRFLRLVRNHGLPRPRCQVPFRDASGRAMRVDFMFGSVVVEVSGKLGHSSETDRRKDARRRNELQQLGFMVLEFTTADVIDEPDRVVATLRRSL